jgi:hypothetical protein
MPSEVSMMLTLLMILANVFGSFKQFGRRKELNEVLERIEGVDWLLWKAGLRVRYSNLRALLDVILSGTFLILHNILFNILIEISLLSTTNIIGEYLALKALQVQFTIQVSYLKSHFKLITSQLLHSAHSPRRLEILAAAHTELVRISKRLDKMYSSQNLFIIASMFASILKVQYNIAFSLMGGISTYGYLSLYWISYQWYQVFAIVENCSATTQKVTYDF